MLRQIACTFGSLLLFNGAVDAQAAVIKFRGSAGARSVTGLLTYDHKIGPADTYVEDGIVKSVYFPGTLSFVSNGYSKSEDFTAIVADAQPSDPSGATDSFTAFVVTGASGREQFYFSVDWMTAEILSNAKLPRALAQGPATFTYFYAGDEWSLPVTFAAAAVPEPSTWLMLLLGIGACGAALRNRRPRPRLGTANQC